MNFCGCYNDCFSGENLKNVKPIEEIYKQMFECNTGYIIFNEFIFDKEDIVKVLSLLYDNNVHDIIDEEKFLNLSLYTLCGRLKKYEDFPCICNIKGTQIFINTSSDIAIVGIRYICDNSISTYTNSLLNLRYAVNLMKKLTNCVHGKTIHELRQTNKLYNLYKKLENKEGLYYE